MPVHVVAGRYELKELLGEGGMGVVYRGIDTRTGSLVAIKTLRDASDPYTLEMFRKEWAVLARLCHPNIVDIRDVDEIEEGGVRKPCFVMPLLPGVTLASLIRNSSARLTVERVVGIIRQVCLGLQAAHEQELVHRDLKPSNIFVMDDDTAKIIDFGLVHATDVKSSTGLKGTWQYMAPEQVEGKPPSRRSDIYSLGVVAYEALTGQQPFRKKKLEDTAEAIRHLIPPVISEINPKVSQAVGKVIHIAMAKQPIHRYASAREFSETLLKAFLNQPIERFDPARIRPRIERSRAAFSKGDYVFASEILTELQAEGNVDPEITLLHSQIEESVKQNRIRQLFESAQTRVEQDEIPMALDKLREILELDRDNPQALAMRNRIEEQRSQQQISRWLSLARQHFERHDFQEARQALKEVFQLRYDEAEGLQLLSEIDVQEKEAAKARAEKEQLYGSALKLYQSGEISTALSKLEKIIEVSRRTPGATVPERDAVYQTFYNRVRSERDSIDTAYAEGRRHLTEKNFDKALEVCDGMLTQYPKNAQFQALRLKVEQAQRQELSAYIAEVGKAVDTEPNLDRRVGILEEACKRHPNEMQFQQSLRLVQEHRDLVASILSRAKHYEEQGQFGEAIGQWKILANIHPQYPGVEFEISQLERRREQQAAEEKKARFVEQIDRALENSAFSKAEQLARDALGEFPQDAELTILARIAREGLEKGREAERLFEEAKQRRAAGDTVEATELLERALKLDSRSFGIRNMLVGLLVERAHAALNEHWRKAEPLAQSASELDPDHPSVKRIQVLIAETKRKDYVSSCVSEAREMQTMDPAKALEILERGLEVYKGDPKLLQYRANLRNQTIENKRAAAAGVSGPPADVERTRVDHPPPPAETTMLSASATRLFSDLDRTTADVSIEKPKAPEKKPPKASAQTREKIAALGAASLRTLKPITASAATQLKAQIKNFNKIDKFKKIDFRSRNVQWAVAGILVVLAGLIGLSYLGKRHGTSSTEKNAVAADALSVHVTTIPADAQVKVSGIVQQGKTLQLKQHQTYTVTVSRPGYKTVTLSGLYPTKSGWKFTLQPEPLHIHVFTAETSGRVLLDGRAIANLEQGEMQDFELAPDGARHVLSTNGQRGELFRIAFQSEAGKRPTVESLTTQDLIVTSSLGKRTTVWSGSLPKAVLADGKAPQNIPREGLQLELGNQDRLTIGDSKRRQAVAVTQGNAPFLSVSLESSPNLGSITITTAAQNAVLFVDGKQKSTRKPGSWYVQTTPGAHTIKLVADGMQDVDTNVTVGKGENIVRAIEMQTGLAALTVEGGTAGAQVLVDGKEIGALDASGNLDYSGLSAGVHSIEFRKEGFNNLTTRQPFSAGQKISLHGDYLAMTPLQPAVTIDVIPRDAKVSTRRAGETEWHTAQTYTSLRMPAGTYEFKAEADGYNTLTKTLSLTAGKTNDVDLILSRSQRPAAAPPPSPSSYFDQPLSTVNSWLTAKSSNSVAVRAGLTKFHLIFLRPDQTPSGVHRPKRLEWTVTLDGDNRISYSLDAHQLTRRVRLGGQESKLSEQVDAADGTFAYSLLLNLEPHRFQIKNKGGTLLDEFTDGQRDWSRARIAIRGDALFLVRP